MGTSSSTSAGARAEQHDPHSKDVVPFVMDAGSKFSALLTRVMNTGSAPILSAAERDKLPESVTRLLVFAATTPQSNGLAYMLRRVENHLAMQYERGHVKEKPKVTRKWAGVNVVERLQVSVPLAVVRQIADGTRDTCDIPPGTSILYNGAFGVAGVMHFGVFLGHFSHDTPMPAKWIAAVAARIRGDTAAGERCSVGQYHEFASLNSGGRIDFSRHLTPRARSSQTGAAVPANGFAARGGVDIIAQVTTGSDSGEPRIALTTLHAFCVAAADQRSSIYSVQFKARFMTHASPLRTLYRTLCAVGTLDYHMKNFNCEHVSTWLVTGYLQSGQARLIVKRQEKAAPAATTSRWRRLKELGHVFVSVTADTRKKLAEADERWRLQQLEPIDFD